MSWTYIQGILMLAGINMIAVLGLSLLTGFTGLFSFGHAGFMAIGAYVSAYLSKYFLNDSIFFIFSILAGAIAALLVGILVGGLILVLASFRV